jgi:hypothetical protein
MSNYPNEVYGWNHYEGDSPEMNSIGLPLEFANADLPTSIPEGGDSMSTDDAFRTSQLSYSPGIAELGTFAAQDTGPQAQPPKAATPATPATNTAQPGLWKAVGNAIFGGTVSVSKQNSTAAVASGESTLSTQ